MNPVSARLLNQQLAAPQFSDPAAVVSWLGAVQAQEYRMMRWAVAMRTRRPSYTAFRKAFDEGRIVRSHLLRTTWQLVAGEDFFWMLDLCRTNALRGLHGWMKANGISIPKDEEMAVRQVFADVLAQKPSVFWEDFDEALRERGTVMDRHRLSYHIRLSEFEGFICSGHLHASRSTYSLASAKLPAAQPVPREEALALLARRYFRSHAPATLEDFVWWSGLNIGDCRRGVAALGSELRTERWRRRDFLVHEDCRTRGCRSGRLLLLPAFDEYLIGYKSRDVVLHPDHAHHAHNQMGTFKHVLALDGEIVGNWNPYTPSGAPTVFKSGLSLPPCLFDSAFSEFGRVRENL